MMERTCRRLTEQIWNAANTYVSVLCKRSVCRLVKPRESNFQYILGVPWLAFQCRGIKITGTDVKVGNVIEKNGCLYEVLKAQHTQHGRGGATMQVELRDLESGLKLSERLRTSEPIEKVYLEDRTFTFLYEEGDTVFMMDPETFEQVELSKSIFGKRAAYLTDGIPITVSFHEGKALSGQIPIRMTCTVAEAEPSFRGQSVSAQYKKLVLENGRTIMGPTYLEAGDKIVVNTIEETYLERAAKR